MEYANIQKVSGKRPNALGSKELTGQAKKDIENWLSVQTSKLWLVSNIHLQSKLRSQQGILDHSI